MHEMGVVRQLLSQAEAAADGGSVRRLHLRIGALSGMAPEYLRDYIDRHAIERWGYSPTVEIEESDDASEANALGVFLISVEV